MVEREITWVVNDMGCWICNSHCLNKANGYPWKRHNGKHTKISHIMYERVNGVGSVGDSHVLHSCDNPLCINPDHLSLGTHKENMKQMQDRGRLVVPKGEKHHLTKFVVADIIDIRESVKSSRQLAIEYEVAKSTIVRIRNRKSWKDVL